MIPARNRWTFPKIKDQTPVRELMETFGITELVAKILVVRGYANVEDANAFLRPELDQLNDPFLMHDMDKAVERISIAIENGERIIVYGDYDVDGMTSTAIMTWALEILGADVDYFVPNRFTDGYGPNLTQYQRLAEDGMQLLVTVDNGITGGEAVDWLMNAGIDVVITDHHELPAELPHATAVVHPRHPEGNYPFGGLSGSGVAFKVASALLEAPADEVLDLAALGTVADIMSLTAENRVLVANGLQTLKEDSRPGLAALLKAAGTDLSTIDAGTIGFTIGPRLNSIGRLADPTEGVRLLLTEDIEEAEKLAAQVNKLNLERQVLVDTVFEAAMNQVEQFSDVATLVIANEGWHEGILGIVAAKIVEVTGKPTLLLTKEGDRLKGSGRSVPAFDLYTALNNHRELFTAFGGHASAAGISLQASNLDALRTAFESEAGQQNLSAADLPELRIAAQIDRTAFTRENYAALQVLAPFGEGNPEPLFMMDLQGVENVKTMSEGKHLRFMAQTANGNVPVVAFGRGALASDFEGRFDKLHIIGTMSENTFRGNTSYQMMLRDVVAEGSALLDWRTSHLTKQTLNQPASYVFFQHNLYDQVRTQVGANGEALWWEDAFNKTQLGTMALVDLPTDLSQLQELLQFVPAQRIAPIFFVKKPVYMEKMPDRSTFTKVYKFVLQHPNLKINEQLQQVADYLKIAPVILTLIIKVFLEAKFVTIENGLLAGVAKPTPVELESMPSYQAFIKRRELEQKLIYSSTAELEQLLFDLSKQEN